ncbi:MAG: FMN-binding protein [Kiritimatiellaceae bacterium]|nr:FMN-binding protein [Kiritimatiellaceae bacterium]
MNSKRFLFLLAWLCLCGWSPADTKSETFIEASLGQLPVKQALKLKGEVAQAVRSVYGGRYPALSIPYWQQAGKRVWILKARGKHGYVHAGFVVEEGRLIKTEVLAFKEQRGKFINTSRFLRQFTGVGLKKNGQLDRRIDGYSGATLSVNSMKKMARLALLLDSLVPADSD